ncbi:PQQ-dependent sugar dehydrogenase [Pseudochryseolinea flava]|uniref:PQQ-dependent sugar dehydrogenase n=1 Tax=Pseudochryseolinea flava TaxID=2059302 RepID=A0A364Y4I7_9BACT|nr:PQQ-dependent sugar dehydrogenase [Pseudochryseolinea flava]RAW01078.1 PQQ-dependent sugar dehydrogenase [Pseudochryseolinea flava]
MQAKRYLIAMVACLSLVVGCSDDDDDDDNDNPQTGAPVETLPANTTYKPAFTGQTRIGSVQTTTPIKATIITSELEKPWGVTSLPDGRLLITEKAGKLRIVTTTGEISDALLGVPSVNAEGQGGLLGLCIDPQFNTNRMVYWAFSESSEGGTHTAVAKGRLSNDEKSIENATVIYRAAPSYNGDLHYGGRVIFDGSGNLFVSTGERSDLATRPLAQATNAALGKIIRITTDGEPAAGNPDFPGDALPELYSIGHRNPQGIARHPETGDLWQSEHGPRGGDEINRVVAGTNYGWPTITYGIEYTGATIGDGIQQKDGLAQPVYYWDPVISPSGITFYDGDRVPEWEDNLFIGALSGKHIARLVINDDNKVVGEERLLADQNQRFRDITQGPDDALYAVTDEGRLYKIDRE